jgi:hypothetical protein
MDDFTIILVMLPTPRGPRLQQEIFAKSILMDSGGKQIRYTTLENKAATLILSDNVFVIMEGTPAPAN